MLITPAYRDLNAQKHAASTKFGTSGHLWAENITDLGNAIDALTLLDYGCGKRTLERAIQAHANAPFLAVRGYDPAIPDLAGWPDPADLVACTDVLEHIEPECLDAVLDDIRRCALKAVFLVIATRPANKHLADGRNAHLIVEEAAWWMPKLLARWKLLNAAQMGEEILFAGLRR